MVTGELLAALVAAVVVSGILGLGGWIYRYRISNRMRRWGLRILGASVINSNQAADEAHFVDRIHTTKPRTAKLIETSAATIPTILHALKEERTNIQLLVKHPDSVGEFQRERIHTNLSNLLSQEFKTYEYGFEVRCYRAFSSVRGRMLDQKIVNVGWVIPTDRVTDDGRKIEIEGRTNPLVTAHIDQPEGQMLGDMFSRLWDTLWNASDTEGVALVLKRRPQMQPYVRTMRKRRSPASLTKF